MFNFTGCRQIDVATTKSLAMVGRIIPLYRVELAKPDLVLSEEIKRAVPYSWDPASLSSFIENYGTHIVTSATIGGRDVVYIRQHQASHLSASDIDNYLKDIGDQRFSDSRGNSGAGALKYKDKAKKLPSCLSKLLSIVNDPNTDAYISWGSSGTSIIIWDHIESVNLLPEYFKHNNFSFFVYQLNNYVCSGSSLTATLSVVNVVFIYQFIQLQTSSLMKHIKSSLN